MAEQLGVHLSIMVVIVHQLECHLRVEERMGENVVRNDHRI